MTEALLRVRNAVQRALDGGEIGVLAARLDISEGRLREFAAGNNHAISVEEAVRIARHVFTQGDA